MRMQCNLVHKRAVFCLASHNLCRLTPIMKVHLSGVGTRRTIRITATASDMS